jgi:hypothetical protein
MCHRRQCNRPLADLRPNPFPSEEAIAPKSVLINDLSPTKTLARLKMRFLGINRRSYIQIRGFHGTAPPTIDREIAEIVRRVRRFATAGERAASKD